jgi:hypothetical protein
MSFKTFCILVTAVIIAWGLWVNFKPAEAKALECWQGDSISEQSSVGCKYLENKRYHGLYNFRNWRP